MLRAGIWCAYIDETDLSYFVVITNIYDFFLFCLIVHTLSRFLYCCAVMSRIVYSVVVTQSATAF